GRLPYQTRSISSLSSRSACGYAPGSAFSSRISLTSSSRYLALSSLASPPGEPSCSTLFGLAGSILSFLLVESFGAHEV
ncbi:hypothetical protein PFISCL1PPCAC_17058, partial [Pristionchus fissidentatus]